jgi:hypothetical protein
MKSSDGMFSNVGISFVSLLAVDNSINGVIALLSFVGLLLGESQVFMLLQKDNTEQWWLFHLSNIFESAVVIVVVVVVVASMLKINFFIMIERNTYMLFKMNIEMDCIASLWMLLLMLFYSSVSKNFHFLIHAMDMWSYESTGGRTILSCTHMIQLTHLHF